MIGNIVVPFKHQIKTIIHCNWKDIEKLIQTTYNEPDYNIIESEEWNNYSDYSFYIKKIELTDWEIEDLADICNFDTLRSILTDLCNKEVIPEGEYLINVNW